MGSQHAAQAGSRERVWGRVWNLIPEAYLPCPPGQVSHIGPSFAIKLHGVTWGHAHHGRSADPLPSHQEGIWLHPPFPDVSVISDTKIPSEVPRQGFIHALACSARDVGALRRRHRVLSVALRMWARFYLIDSTLTSYVHEIERLVMMEQLSRTFSQHK